LNTLLLQVEAVEPEAFPTPQLEAVEGLVEFLWVLFLLLVIMHTM
jgi:hypothetical protein